MKWRFCKLLKVEEKVRIPAVRIRNKWLDLEYRVRAVDWQQWLEQGGNDPAFEYLGADGYFEQWKPTSTAHSR